MRYGERIGRGFYTEIEESTEGTEKRREEKRREEKKRREISLCAGRHFRRNESERKSVSLLRSK
jgi:hypothetical protein